jgi:hypothetical protein
MRPCEDGILIALRERDEMEKLFFDGLSVVAERLLLTVTRVLMKALSWDAKMPFTFRQ